MPNEPTPVLIRNERPAERYSKHPRHLHAPLSLKYVCSGLKELTSKNAVLLDNWLLRISPQKLFHKAMLHNVQVVVIEGNSSCMEESVELANLFKTQGITTVATGQQVAHAANQDFPRWIEAFDIPVLGEPEEAVPRLIARMVDQNSIVDLCAQYAASFQRKEFVYVEDVDALPLPECDPDDAVNYPFFPVRKRFVKNWRYVQTSWGCTHSDQCLFCSDMVRKSCGPQLRVRKPEKVVDEIELYLHYGTDGICFEDNSLFNDREHILAICREIMKRQLDFSWIASVRADECDKEVVTAAAEAGAVLLKVGVESGSPRIIEMLGKSGSGKEWLAAVRSAFSLFRENNIGSVALVMIGCPGETESEMRATMHFVKELHPDYVQIQMFSVYPDSVYYQQLDADKKALYLINGDMSHFSMPLHTVSQITPESLMKLQDRFYHEFYFRLSYVFLHLTSLRHYYWRPSVVIDLLRKVGGELCHISRIATFIKRYPGYPIALMIVFLFLAMAEWSGSTLSETPYLQVEDYPYNISEELLMEAVPPGVEHVYPMDNGIIAHENVWLDFNIEIPSSGILPVYLIARGTPAAGYYPSVVFKVNGKFHDALFCTSEEWGVYRIFLDLCKGRQHFSMSYQNDGFHYPEDRNIAFKELSVGEAPGDVAKYYRWKAPVLIPFHKMSMQSYAEYRNFETVLLGSGSIGDDIYFGVSGKHQFHFGARLKDGNKDGTTLQVMLDGKEIRKVDIVSDQWQRLDVDCEVESKGLHRLEILNIGSSNENHDVVFGSLCVGECSEASLIPEGPLILKGQKTVMKSEEWDYVYGGEHLDQTVVLWSNGCMKKRVKTGTPFSGRLSIEAKGEPAFGIWTKMTVMADWDQIARFTVDGYQYKEYTVDLDLRKGDHKLMIVFDNDAMDPEGGDRNLFVKQLTFTPR